SEIEIAAVEERVIEHIDIVADRHILDHEGLSLQQERAGDRLADLARHRPVGIALVDTVAERALAGMAAVAPFVGDVRRLGRRRAGQSQRGEHGPEASRHDQRAGGGAYLLSGSANTQSAEPPSGMAISGVKVASERISLEPLPTATATYCLPPAI